MLQPHIHAFTSWSFSLPANDRMLRNPEACSAFQSCCSLFCFVFYIMQQHSSFLFVPLFSIHWHVFMSLYQQVILPLSVSGSIPCLTALDYMTVCRPKSFLYVCTQQTSRVRGEGIIHSSSSSSSSHTHTHTHTRAH